MTRNSFTGPLRIRESLPLEERAKKSPIHKQTFDYLKKIGAYGTRTVEPQRRYDKSIA